jgi:uncharacterized protein (DUF2384 family)
MQISNEELKDLYDIGIQVFGGTGEFDKWLKKPSFGLDKQIPGELLNTNNGVESVKAELIRIAYGDLA